MKMLFDPIILVYKKSKDTLTVECEHCSITFLLKVKEINRAIREQKVNPSAKRGSFCSHACCDKSRTLSIKEKCAECNTPIITEAKNKCRSISGNNFCSIQCANLWNKKNRKCYSKGIRRSKLEFYIEEKISEIFFDLEEVIYSHILPNGLELDIYIPELNLAFELNGPFHYRPIFGEDKLKKRQRNDRRKARFCKKNNIELIVINVSKQKKFSINNAQPFWQRVHDKIKAKCAETFFGIVKVDQ